MVIRPQTQRGFTLVELVIALALAALILLGTSGLVNNSIATEEVVAERNRLQQDARFAMQQMVRATAGSRDLLLPLPDKDATNWRENVREETVPASPPEGSSTKATAVLAVSLDSTVDLDANGVPDADNDADGRIDEDLPADIVYDFDPGIHLIDDGGNGSVDEGFLADADDDESMNMPNEDPINGVDDDADGVTDEDPNADMNGDGAPGFANVDDDGDGIIDEGSNSDDDEDGSTDEDWIDAVVFYLQGDSLVQRHPLPWDETANGFLSGRDFIISTIANDVTRFRVERLESNSSGQQLVDLTLELTGSGGAVVSVNRRVRVGGAQ